MGDVERACADWIQEAHHCDRLAASLSNAAVRCAAEPHRLGDMPHSVLQSTSRAIERGCSVFWGPAHAGQPLSEDTLVLLSSFR